jgi:hypothetical protein
LGRCDNFRSKNVINDVRRPLWVMCGRPWVGKFFYKCGLGQCSHVFTVNGGALYSYGNNCVDGNFGITGYSLAWRLRNRLWTGRERMRFYPQRASLRQRINSNFLPPRSFVAMPMDLAMMSSAQGDGELVTDLAAKCSALGKA